MEGYNFFLKALGFLSCACITFLFLNIKRYEFLSKLSEFLFVKIQPSNKSHEIPNVFLIWACKNVKFTWFNLNRFQILDFNMDMP